MSKPFPHKQTAGSAKTERRQRSDDEKLKIVLESFEDGVVQAHLARRHGISTSQLWDWRKRYKGGQLVDRAGFSEVVVLDETSDSTQAQPSCADIRPDLVVEVGRQYRLMIPAGFDMDAAARLLRGLA